MDYLLDNCAGSLFMFLALSIQKVVYLTIIPRARMGSKSIEAEGRMSY